MIIVDKLVGVGNINKKMGDIPYNRTERKIFNSTMILILIAFVYSIFLPLKLGTLWFYIGLAVYLLGLVMFILAIVNMATTPHGEPFTQGAYRYSRHPMIFWGNIMHLGMSIASGSWVFLLFSIIAAILFHYLVIPEEQDAMLLVTLPGVAYYTALLIKSEIGIIKRLPSAKQLCSYAGLVSSTYASGNMCQHGHITKQG